MKVHVTSNLNCLSENEGLKGHRHFCIMYLWYYLGKVQDGVVM